MKSTHITKAIALVMTVMMLVSCVPSSVLPVFASTDTEQSNGVFDTVQLGKVNNTESYSSADYAAAPSKQDVAGNTTVNDEFSPYEPYTTNDETHPFLPNGSAWIDLKNIYYGAPATPNMPITKWSANTSVVNITGTGDYYAEGNYVQSGKEIYAIDDMNLIDEYLWADSSATVGGNTENGIVTGGNTDTPKSHSGKITFYTVSGDSERKFYNYATGKRMEFLKYVDQYTNDPAKEPTLDAADDIFDLDGNHISCSWDGQETKNDQTIYKYSYSYSYFDVEEKDGTREARVYNRYDAMQGKWGLTLDNNVSSVMWSPTWAASYHADGSALNNSDLYLSDTPYLFYSTEAPDSTQIAISLLIGAPVQGEKKKNDDGQTYVKQNSYGNYEFRWYTITDNSARPGVDYEATKNNSMVPLVTVSDVVYDHYTLTSSSSDLLGMMNANDPDSLNPIKVAQNAATAAGKTFDENTMYVNGAITGCIDFTQLLPLVMGMVDSADDNTDNGRKDVKYKIAQVRVDTKTADGGVDSAARINYLYFGPGQAAVYTPQSSVGNDVNGANWMYAHLDDDLGDQNPNYVAKNRYTVDQTDTDGNVTNKAGDVMSGNYYIGNDSYDYDCGYTNGWDNGVAVSITNTPANPQLMTIDTYGQNGGTLITYDEYYTERLNYYQSIDAADGKDDDTINGQSIYWLAEFTRTSTDSNSRVWKYTDKNGQVQYLETEWNHYDNKHYIMVTVPIRKWVNVLGDSRKLAFSVNILNEGNYAGMEPTFCMWGNHAGALGCGHGDIAVGNRYRNEDMIAVFGNGYYQVDCSYNYHAAEIDKVLGNSTFYDGSDNWYDILQSPYVYNLTVTDTVVDTYGTARGYGDEMIGYTFVTAIRYAVPVGMSFTVQNMKGDGNSAGLNTYSNSGDIVAAYDGGTGIQPEIHTGNALTEYIADENNNITENGTVNGAQTSGSAAYGPMLEASYYTIYDLLDTERLNAAGNSSHVKGQEGKDEQKVYGQVWTMVSAQPIRRAPVTWATIDGYTYGSGHQVPVYGTVKFTESNQLWGITGTYSSDQYGRFGYVLLESGDTVYAKEQAGVRYKDYTFTNYKAWYASVGASDESAAVDPFRTAFLDELRNEWVLSNFMGDYADFQDKDGNSDANPIINPTHSVDQATAIDVYAKHHSNVQLQYGNMWGNNSRTNSYTTLRDISFRAVNTTDMELDLNRKYNTSSNASLGMTRVFDEPILLHTNTIHKSFPVFYYDFTAPAATGSCSMAIGLSLLVDGKNCLYYLNASGLLQDSYTGGLGGNMYGYFSFEDIITATENGTTTVQNKTYPKYGKVEVVGFSIYFWRSGSYTGDSTITIRRAEIWQEETDWLDTIISDNQYMGGNKSTNMAATVKDSMNIITDAYYHGHDERNDGNITVTNTGNQDTSTGVNESIGYYDFTHTDKTTTETLTLPESQFSNLSNEQFDVTRTESYRKSNSNKGWSARIQADTNDDGVIDGDDTRFFSYDFNSETMTRVKNGEDDLYEFRSALGHLRVWVPEHQTYSIVFESDRSFNTRNYKYLYYSYSMRDVATGISAEDKSADYKGSGISVAIKGQQNHSDMAYLEMDGSWIYYPDGTNYWSTNIDYRQFNTTMNAALDLSTTDLESINQLVFYLNNEEDSTAEFYLNYIYLSNVAPTELITKELEQVQTQYYYLMDNTGDRYSARFPTIDNPTGQVTGLNSDADRVNPVKVVRGQLLSTGTYFNGDRLYGYGELPDGTTTRTFDDDTASDGYYEKMYGTSEANANAASNGSMKNILFYNGTSSDLNDINDYYTYLDRGRIYTYSDADGNLVTETVEPDGEGNIYDMMWSFGRWFTGDGEGGLNIMYIGDGENAPDHQQQDANFRAEAISGGLTRRYATENYVLLRSGITPKTFTTYYDANGGEFLYESSPNEVTHLQKMTENSYYITQNVILSYFTQPKNIDTMKGAEGSDENVFLKKPGYKFSHWEHIDNATGEPDQNFNTAEGVTNPAEFVTYIKKQGATADYFKAVWVELKKGDEGYDLYGKDANGNYITYDAKFYADADKTSELTTLTVGAEENNNNGRYVLRLPTATKASNGYRQPIYGWKNETTGKIYSPGDKVYVLEDTEFTPMTEAVANMVYNITLQDAQLYVWTTNGILNPVEKHGASVTSNTKDGVTTYKYTNIPRNYNLYAKPDNARSGYGWVEVNATTTTEYGVQYVTDSTSTILSANKDGYEFTSHESITIAYQDISSTKQAAFYVGQTDAYATIAPNYSLDALEDNKIHFTSQFALPENCVVQAYGTLFTKDTYYSKYLDAETATDVRDAKMRLNPSSINAASVAAKNYQTAATSDVRYVQAETCSDFNEYSLNILRSSKSTNTYYARAYVIYTDASGEYHVAYSNVVAYSLNKKLTTA